MRLWLRGRREPAYRLNIGERFGRYAGARVSDCIWIHGVSVGETRAAQPIVEHLIDLHPRCTIVMSHMTPTGREAGRTLYGDRVVQSYLPYDFPGAVQRFLEHFDPRLGLIMETEVWPNLIHACRDRDIPVYLVNARLSEKSYRGYARLGRITSEAFSALSGIAAQSDADAERFRRMGVQRLRVTGNVKFDIHPSPDLVARGVQWREQMGLDRSVFVAASTREGEEGLLLDALDNMHARHLLMIVVPRHPQRFEEIARLLAARNIAYRRRSRNEIPDPGTSVWLGDSMGEMAAYLAASDIVFMGGSLLPFGAHNLVEACALGKPVVIGPSVFNFQEAVDLGVAAGAVVRVKDAQAVATEVSTLFADRDRLKRIGEAGAAFARAHRGAVARVFEFIDQNETGNRDQRVSTAGTRPSARAKE